jgi:cyclic pyranopterin phosphate synthase
VIDDDRKDRFLPLTKVRLAIEDSFSLLPSLHKTSGPARYWDVPDLGIKLGMISPLTGNFCESCNRIRVSASGKLYMCLGHEDHIDLLAALRSGDATLFDCAVDQALRLKPKAHSFDLSQPATARHMNVTGG